MHPRSFVAASLIAVSLLGGLAAPKPRPAAAAAQDGAASSPTPAQTEHFEKRIRPLLTRRCVACHGPSNAKAGLRLDSRAGFTRGGESGPIVDDAKPGEGRFLRSIQYVGDLKMPPAGKLPQAEIELLSAWVRDGAPWGPEAPEAPAPGKAAPSPLVTARNHWAYQPVRRPKPPQFTTPADRAWSGSPIDAFILQGLKSRGLRPAAPADRRTLIRRVTFDLTGLPPTPADIRAFVEDRRPDAWQRVVDRLLDSPDYGERWGRHWLDVARYADSNGLDENTAFANAWRYRDYVIDSLNRDKPYDQFIKEQIAGDLLPPTADVAAQRERTVATGFLVLGPKVLAEPDKQKMVMDIVDEQIDVVSKAILGTTLSCARCHDHKFDPFSLKDYYALAGIFKSTRTMASLATVAKAHERPLSDPATVAAAEAHRKELEARQTELRTDSNRLRAAATRRVLAQADRYLLAARQVDPAQLPLGEVRDPLPAGSMVIEAEAFARGDVQVTREGFGQGIGIVESAGRSMAFTEYEFEITAPATRTLAVRYASGEPRPVRLMLDGQLVSATAAGRATGGFFPRHQIWESIGQVSLTRGKHLLRLQQTETALPHVDRFVLLPQAPAGDAPNGPAAIAKRNGLDGGVLGRLAAALSSGQSSNVLGPWRAFAALPEAGFASEAQRLIAGWKLQAPRGWLRTVLEPFLTGTPPASLAEVAQRYRTVLTPVNDQWLRESGRPNRPAERLREVEPEAIRVFLYRGGQGFGLEAIEETYAETDRVRLASLRKAVGELEAKTPRASEMALAVEDAERVEDCRIHLRGNHLALGEAAPRVMPAVLTAGPRKAVGTDRSGRLELAEWLARPDHPLIGRVIVNRLWQHHFGEGIVRSSDNFGTIGEKPSHPELLDWLAAVFVAGREPSEPTGCGWSLKAMHRLILNSNAYKMSTAYDPRSALVDPENRLLWRFHRRRLEVEAIRDSILATAGSLEATRGGTLLKTPNFGYVTNDQSANQAQYDAPRRSIYLPVIRNAVYDVFQAFDFVEPSFPNGKRSSTTVAPQALFLMNSPLVLAQSRLLAERLLKDPTFDNDPARVNALFWKAYGRAVKPEEQSDAVRFLAEARGRFGTRPDPQTAAWASFCQLIFASSEFITVD